MRSASRCSRSSPSSRRVRRSSGPQTTQRDLARGPQATWSSESPGHALDLLARNKSPEPQHWIRRRQPHLNDNKEPTTSSGLDVLNWHFCGTKGQYRSRARLSEPRLPCKRVIQGRRLMKHRDPLQKSCSLDEYCRSCWTSFRDFLEAKGHRAVVPCSTPTTSRIMRTMAPSACSNGCTGHSPL